MIRALVLACILVVGLAAAEWRIEAAPGAPGTVAIPRDALAGAGRLALRIARLEADDSDAWIELRLVTADGRRFAWADPLRLAAGESSASAGIGLDAGSWAGDDGPLGGDATEAMAAIELAVHGGRARVAAAVEAAAAPGGDPRFAVELAASGLVKVGPWRELRLRLLGGIGCERGSLDLVDASHRRWPLFLDQPGAPDAAGRWRARGPARWILRLADGEAPVGPATLAWRDGERTWESAPLAPPTAVAGEESLAATAVGVLPLPRSPAVAGDAFLHGSQGWLLAHGRGLPEALAPVLAWRADWTGFRGPGATAWAEAEELDRAAAAGMAAVDLLPDGLADEHGPFRFGLSPWTTSEGVWHSPRDLWSDDRPWDAWLAHVRTVIARCRAAPGLAQWNLGMARSATGEEQDRRLRKVAEAIANLVAGVDPRPVVAVHPQLADWGRRDPKGTWFDFSEGVAGWALGPAPFVGMAAFEPRGGSDGGGFIAAVVPPGADPRAVGLRVPVDGNLFNLERVEADVGLDGGGSAALFAWVTDHHHRWWQQRLVGIPGDGGWQTVGVDFGPDAAWTCGTSGVAWSEDLRRRIRAFGIVAYVRGAAPGARLRVDRVRRLGWPRLAAEPKLAVLDLRADAKAGRWTPITASFRLNLDSANPYDPDEADVVGVVTTPDGGRIVQPAYWYEPYRLDFDGATERAVPDGAGSWRWRWTPPAPGAWRWHLVARIKRRDVWVEAESPWQTTVVAADATGLPPVRVDPKDRRWFSDADGKFWFPIGINLRSPGDVRQNNDLDRERAFASAEAARPSSGPAESRPAAAADDVRNWRSADWEQRGTRSYERWFALMQANGMDWARVWMCPWWCGLEWRRDWDDYGGLTWFSQANAARMDRVVELAAASRVRLQVELMNHGMVGEHADREWTDSPYNRANGGPCRSSAEWFRSEEVWKINLKRLRYTLARWGGDSAIAAWSLCSELEWTSGFREETGNDERAHSPTVDKWVRRVLAWMKQNEVFPDRPATIHFSHPWSDPEMWRIEGLGFSNSNAYSAFQDFDPSLGKGRQVPRNLPLALECYLDDLFPPQQLGRPTLLGEWGGHWADNSPWLLRGELRTGIWLQACTPYAGDTGFWWWLWIDAADRWRDFRAVAAFVRDDDPRGREWQRLQPPVRSPGNRIFAEGMRCADRMRLYCWPRGYDQDFRRTARGAEGTVTIPGVAAGSRWEARRYDCATGAVIATSELVADPAGALALPVSGLDPDAAFKLRLVR